MPIEQATINLKPEIELLLACTRKAIDSHHSSRVTQILQAKIDWPLLISVAERNGLLPLLCYHLTQFSDALPPDDLAKIKAANRQNTVRALFLSAELRRITDGLQLRGITGFPYKGPVLACLAYGNETFRQFDDLDIVVQQDLMVQVYAEMDALGYEPRFSRERFLSAGGKDIPGEYVFIHKINRAVVEFHTERTLRHFPQAPNLAGMISRASAIELNGQRISTFSVPDTLLLLCVHGAKDFWSRIIWVSDVAAVSAMLTDADCNLLLEKAKECGAERMVVLGLWLAQALFPESNLPAVNYPQCDRATVKIGAALRDHLLERRPFSETLLWRSLYRIQMVRPLRKGISYWLRLTTAPAEEDWLEDADSTGRHVSYALRRPLRLWRKYGGAARHSDSGSEG